MMSHYIIFVLYKTFITVIKSIDFLPFVYSLILFHLIFLKKLYTKVTLIWFSSVCISSCCFTFPLCGRALLYKLYWYIFPAWINITFLRLLTEKYWYFYLTYTVCLMKSKITFTALIGCLSLWSSLFITSLNFILYLLLHTLTQNHF